MKDFHAAQHSVHPIPGKVRRGQDGGSLRVFKPFSWLAVGSVKVALSRPTWLSSLSRHTSTPKGHNASRWAACRRLAKMKFHP
jgi:hypothetical protein